MGDSASRMVTPPHRTISVGPWKEFEQAREPAAVGGRSVMADLARISTPERGRWRQRTAPPGRRKPGRVTKAGCLTDDARRFVRPTSVRPTSEGEAELELDSPIACDASTTATGPSAAKAGVDAGGLAELRGVEVADESAGVVVVDQVVEHHRCCEVVAMLGGIAAAHAAAATAATAAHAHAAAATARKS